MIKVYTLNTKCYYLIIKMLYLLCKGNKKFSIAFFIKKDKKGLHQQTNNNEVK